MTNCTICHELSNRLDTAPETYREIIISKENILFSSQHLTIIPSYGPLNSSHALIVTNNHVSNFASQCEAQKKNTKLLISAIGEWFYFTHKKKLSFFESGASQTCDHSGGCITHAHIHCILENKEFEKRLFEEVDLTEKESLGIIEDPEQGYIWYMNSDGIEFIKNRPLLPSQFLRYLYMQSSKNPLKWNWRRDIDTQGIKKVIEAYATLKTEFQKPKNLRTATTN